jgi:antitoxin (DNA-binding transcriptional repressor) of toxin-antitoxin stability system
MFVELSTQRKGAVAELEIETAAVKLGIPILKPVTEQLRFDLAFDIAGRIWRVQCKWGRLSNAGDTVIARVGGSWCSPKGYVRTTYTEQEVDLFAIYCGELDRAFLLPAQLATDKHEIRLRLKPPLNCQRACINLAEDFAFEGAVAQLARAFGWQPKGRGFESLQLHSSEAAPMTVAADDFRDHLGYWFDEAAKGEHLLVTRRGKPLVRVSAATSPPPSPPQLPLADPASAPAPG